MTTTSIPVLQLPRLIVAFAILGGLAGPAQGLTDIDWNPPQVVPYPDPPPPPIVASPGDTALVPYIPRHVLTLTEKEDLDENWPEWTFVKMTPLLDSSKKVIGQIPDAGRVITPGQKLHLIVRDLGGELEEDPGVDDRTERPSRPWPEFLVFMLFGITIGYWAGFRRVIKPAE